MDSLKSEDDKKTLEDEEFSTGEGERKNQSQIKAITLSVALNPMDPLKSEGDKKPLEDEEFSTGEGERKNQSQIKVISPGIALNPNQLGSITNPATTHEPEEEKAENSDINDHKTENPPPVENPSAKSEADEKSLKDQLHDRALGCMAGAFIGDALGSFVEFEPKHRISEEKANQAMQMKGGGTWSGILPGQLTDDSELALAMADGLVEGNGVLQLDLIAKHYGLWVSSFPFDIGNTIRNAISHLQHYPDPSYKNAAEKTYAISKNYNKTSQSNGGLMRITPMAIFCLNLTEDELFRAVRAEARLTHSNPVAVEAACFWVLALVRVIRRDDKAPEETYAYIKDHIDKLDSPSELKEWINCVESEDFFRLTSNMGWGKIAWTWGFKVLKGNFLDEEKKLNKTIDGRDFACVMKKIIKEGGDTDTNCCIVGGLLGAIHGWKNLPEEYRNKMLECDPTKAPPRFRRNARYKPSRCLELVDLLLNFSKRTLEIIPQESKTYGCL